MVKQFVLIFVLVAVACGQSPDSGVIDSMPFRFERESLFADSLADSILYSQKERGFFTNRMIVAERIDSATVLISNFTPAQIPAVTLLSSDTTVLFLIDSLAPFSRLKIPLEPPLDSLVPEQFVLVSDDSTFRKINEITVPWFVWFSSHFGGKVTPEIAKKHCALMANFAWLVSDSTFRREYLFDSTYVLLNNRTNKAGDSVNPVIDRNLLFQRLATHRAFQFGVIQSGVAGLGVWKSVDDPGFVGAFQQHSLLGLKYFTFYEQNSSYAMRILAHETGHITIAIDDRDDPDRTGFPSMVGNCYLRLLNERKLPFPDDPF